MKVLVTAASKHGGTTDIATAIAEELRAAGLLPTIVEPSQVTGLDGYDAVVLGSGVYAGRWRFERRPSTALVWSWETRDSVTPRTSPISRRVRFS